MSNDGFQHRTLSRALTSDDHNTRQLQGITLVNTEEHSPNLDEFPCKVHESVPRVHGIV